MFSLLLIEFGYQMNRFFGLNSADKVRILYVSRFFFFEKETKKPGIGGETKKKNNRRKKQR